MNDMLISLKVFVHLIRVLFLLIELNRSSGQAT